MIDIDTVLENGSDCEAVVTIGEVTDVILALVEQLQETPLLKDFKKIVNNDKAVDHFIICLVCSEILTLTETFKKREKVGEA